MFHSQRPSIITNIPIQFNEKSEKDFSDKSFYMLLNNIYIPKCKGLENVFDRNPWVEISLDML